jgi:hypothetical protein
MYFSFTQILCHALSYVYQLTATELVYFKLYVKTFNMLSIRNICCSTKMYSSKTNSPKIQFHSSLCRPIDRDISNRISNIELIIATEVPCCHLYFLHSSKLLDLFHFSFFSLTYCFHFRVC